MKRGSQPWRTAIKSREFDEAHTRLLKHYFGDSPNYDERDFERRFRLPRGLFEKVNQTVHVTRIFVRRRDATGKSGIYSLVRVVTARGMMAYGIAADAKVEYLQISLDSVLPSLKSFEPVVVENFGPEYCREPT